MAILELFPAPLSREGFAAFGDVIETAGAKTLTINEGTTTRFHDLASVDTGLDGGRPTISLFRGTPRARPVAIRMVERHPLGSQAFFPLQDHSWLIVVAPPGDNPDAGSLRAFRATGTQGVNYRRGVWHHPLLVLRPGHEFMVVDRSGPGDNCDEFRFDGEAPRLAL